jgi:hypothetical protein
MMRLRNTISLTFCPAGWKDMGNLVLQVAGPYLYATIISMKSEFYQDIYKKVLFVEKEHLVVVANTYIE